jgi:peptidoglycan/xylan/chitin deacetylase (PgdA/CDA1 family)
MASPPALRRLAGGAPGRLTRYARLRLSARRAGLVLVYHKLGEPPGDPKRELVPALSPQLFEAQVRHLGRLYRVVPARDLHGAAAIRRRGQRFPVAITFDDDLQSHARHALPVLRAAGLSATFFLSGASLERPHRFWWERLQAAVDAGRDLGVLAEAGISAGGTGIHGWGDAIEQASVAERVRAADALAELAGPDPQNAGMRAADVAELAAAGQEIGFHTLCHDPLPALDDTELNAALQDGREALERLAGRRLTAISYPHGKADARVAANARAAGYEWGFTGLPVAVTPARDPLLLPRVEVLNTTLQDFARQLVGALEQTAPD